MACKGFFFSGYAVFAYLYAFKALQTTVLMAHSGFNKVVIMGKYGTFANGLPVHLSLISLGL